MIATHPDLGRGSIKKMAAALKVHPSLISQVLNGIKDFTSEQANDLAIFFGLKERETEYFLCLVNIERAGNTRLKAFLQNKLGRLAESYLSSQRSTAATFQIADGWIDNNSYAAASLATKPADSSDFFGPVTSKVSRRHSRTVSISLSDDDKKNLQIMIDNFVAKISTTESSLNTNQLSVVTIDLFEIGSSLSK